MPRRMRLLRGLGYFVLAASILSAVTATAAYRRDMDRALERVSNRSTVISSAHGEIEYSEGGSGPPVLVVHGSGGGFDQGELIAELFLAAGFHWIAPSRFGYLRSTFDEGATFEDQAHAYAALLDHLGIQRAAVVAFSHGGPSALLFAVLYPERVSSLTLVSAGVVASAAEDQQQADQRGNALVTAFEHDWLYWVATRLFERDLMALMGATDEVIGGLTPEQRAMVVRVIDGMNPTSLRLAGVRFDNRAEMPGDRVAAVRAPTLIFHAADDTLQVFHHAEFAAATIPGAKLVRFEKGGHLVMAVQQAVIREATQQHILDHLTE